MGGTVSESAPPSHPQGRASVTVPPMAAPGFVSLLAMGRFGVFSGHCLHRIAWGRTSAAETLDHMGQLIARCALPVTLTMFPLGAAIGIQGMRIFDLFGAHRLLSALLALMCIRELGPVISSVLIAAQGGSSFAAELGAMRIKEEIDATEVMAVDGLAWHAAPRVLAMTLVVPMLCVSSAGVGILGGYAVAVGLFGQDHGVFMANLGAFVGLWDLVAAVLKGLIYGLLVGLVSTFRGWVTEGGAEGVGRAVNDTVVYSIVFMLVLNYALSTLFFGTVA